MMKLWLKWRNTKWCLVKKDGNGKWMSVNIDGSSLIASDFHGNELPHRFWLSSLHCKHASCLEKKRRSQTIAFWKACCLWDGFGEPWSILWSSLSGNLSANLKKIWSSAMSRSTVSRDAAASEWLRPWAPSSPTLFKFASVCTKLQIRLSTKAYVWKKKI